MRFAKPLIPGRLIRRYKRFLADVRLADGAQITAHCANPGAMTGLAEPGLSVWLEPTDNPKRKLNYTWRLVELGGAWAGIDTAVPNRLVGEALAAGRIPALSGIEAVRPEVRYGAGSRIDFLASGSDGRDTYIEVKNVHLMRRAGLAEFPDSVTKRGVKHMEELKKMVKAGHRAIMVYCVQRDDCAALALARDIDPAYGVAHDRARAAGVEVIAWTCRISPVEIALDHPIPFAETSGGGREAWI